MIDSPEIIQRAAQLAAVIRLTIPRREIRKVMGPAMLEAKAAAESQGIAAGPVFSDRRRAPIRRTGRPN
jgi:hypothetical protein